MEDANNQDGTIDIDDDISDIEEDVSFEGGELDETLFQRLKSNDSNINYLHIVLNPDNDGKCFFNSINWKEDGDYIGNNTKLRKLVLIHQGQRDQRYILGEEGHNLPTKQQLQDFFSCIYRNRSVKEFRISSIDINNKFGGDLIEGLRGHPSLVTLDISNGKSGISNGILGNTLMKVLTHPKCRLKCLALSDCILEDEGVSIICDSLMHNNTLKRLFLDNNMQIGLKQITSVGWRALSTFIRHPNCKLVDLGLYNIGMNDDGAGILGSAFSGSSLKTLSLSSNNSISSAGWNTLFNQLSQTSIESVAVNDNNIGDDGLSALARISTLKSLDLHSNQSITPEGWQLFFDSLRTRGNQLVKLNANSKILGNNSRSLSNLLQTRGTKLVELDISCNRIGDVGVAALGHLLSTNSNTLKILDMGLLSEPYNFNDDPRNITPQGCISLFTTLQDSNLDLVKLDLSGNNIDDECMQLLIRIVSGMSSLKELWLVNNRLVTPIGWQALAAYLRVRTLL